MKKGVPGVSGYQGPAGGWGAVKAVTASLFSQKAVARDIIAMFKMNQVKGFDCPGCAWPDPGHRAPMELCENGVKAVSWETTSKKASPEFFSRHPVSTLWHYSDYELENIGRLTHPMKYDAASDTWQAVDWDIAFQEIGERLRSYDSAQQVEFYTSGRTSNEAAFLYQLFAREYGSSNFPDCSNMCHGPTSAGLTPAIGLGKGTVELDDFDHCDLVICIGHNPGTNHPRMLTTLRDVARRGAKIISINPLTERGLERFSFPQSPKEMFTGQATALSHDYYQVKMGGDASLLKGIMKALIEMDEARIDPHQYFIITESAEQELIKATNELHLMYLHATDKVLKDDNLLALFDIPKILWPRLRLSWQRRRHHMITGRMDFCMDERGLKVYEYNADSASCHTEAGLILERWAERGYTGQGHNPAEGLINELAGAWKHSRARPFVHIMQDKDIEENYHAQFMQQALRQAGFDSKILRGLDELRWDDAGQLIDGDGRLVNCVWKTWAWETAIEQVREVSETEYAAVPIRTGHTNQEVRLIDVLLRPEVLVFEPLWTVIPGNKAILPILWQLFPHHRYLLDTDFTVNEELAQTGYAVKPIAGRCGSNIDLVSHQEELLDKTSGKFAEQKNIYQQLWCLPKVAGKYIQVCTFTVGGNYGGTCLRGDESLVIKKESDIEPLIVVQEA